MALRMDSGVQNAPTHQRTALPKRTSPPDGKSAPPLNGAPSSAVGGRSPASVPRKRSGNNSSKGVGGGGGAGTQKGGGAGGAGASSGGTAGGGSAGQGITGGRESCKKSGSGGGDREGAMYSPARKRVRIVDEKLGEFFVLLQPYTGDHNDICEVCDKGGPLLCCDFCNLVYHLNCAKLTETPKEELWICPACTTEVIARQMNKRRRMTDDGSRASSPGPGIPGLERPTVYHGVKAENDAFRAFVLYKNQSMDIGLYPTVQDAARAYDRKALSLFGDAAVCNFPADEQVEVEGVGADGNTVKGVVRSFHQWRAEMQWGNKKRHLGFFERLDDASYAYNRAAVYMNGGDTPLNPIKEGYIPPPPTGLPVRVPRNKMFVQQLQGPLGPLYVAGTEEEKRQLARRRLQMTGKYHEPLIGPEHQVSRLPPLPPPSRPWAGCPLDVGPPPHIAAVARGSTVLEKVASLEGEDTITVADCVGNEAAATEQMEGRRYWAAGVASASTNAGNSVTSVPLVDGTKCIGMVAVAAAAAAADDSATRSEGQIRSCPMEEDVLTSSPSPPSPQGNRSSSGPVHSACPAVVHKSAGRAADHSGSAPTSRSSNAITTVCRIKVEKPSASKGFDNTPDTITSSEGATPSPVRTAVAASLVDDDQEKKSAGEASEGSNEKEVSITPSTREVAGIAVGVSAVLPSMRTYLENDNKSKPPEGSEQAVAVGAAPARAAIVDMPRPATDQGPSVCAKHNLSSLSPSRHCLKTGTHDGKHLEIDTSLPEVLGEGLGRGDLCLSQTDETVGEEKERLEVSSGASSSPASRSSSPFLERLPIHIAFAAAVQDASAVVASTRAPSPMPAPTVSSFTPVPGMGSGRNASDVHPSAGKSCSSNSSSTTASLSPVLPQFSAVRVSETAVSRKRKLPAATTSKVSLSPSRSGGSGDTIGCSANGYSCGASRQVDGMGVKPDLSLDDVAELMWRPRAGPRPRGMESAAMNSARRGGDAGGDERLERLARAMWDKDSTLLERVAPAHLEKVMHVLQTCRHDVDRAAQMLTVRLGIQVEGLGVRTTRHSRAEKQSSTSPRKPTQIGPGLSWRGGVSSSGGAGGVSSGSRGGASLAGGSQSGAGAGAAGRGGGGGGRKADAQGLTREDTKQANDAFMRFGRDLNAVQTALGWNKKRVVEYYYCVWKFSPQYQVWKARRHHAGLPGVGGGAGGKQYTSPAGSAPLGGVLGSGLPNAAADGMRWRGSRLRTLKTGSSQ